VGARLAIVAVVLLAALPAGAEPITDLDLHSDLLTQSESDQAVSDGSTDVQPRQRTQTAATNAPLPENSHIYLPVLQQQLGSFWPDLTVPSVLAGQVEQETCVSLKSAKCWSTRAELKTKRERGVGLGQITKTKKFDSLAELKVLFPDALSRFGWHSPYDPVLQLRALVLKDQYNYARMSFAATEPDRIAFALAAYNGGMGGVFSDRQLCMATTGCDPNRWYGNVEKTSLKAATTVKGYGQSFFCINRQYPWRIMFQRSDKYRAYFRDNGVEAELPSSPALYGC